MQTTKQDDHKPYQEKFLGGPHNVGDPNDRSLRKVEEFIFVTQVVKDRAHTEKCKQLIKDWGRCMESRGIDGPYTCLDKTNAMNSCLKHWYQEPEFRAECREIYLDKRQKYRETGVIEKEEKKPYYIPMRLDKNAK